ncbi:hypothetical protein E2C01_099604 [Portunus trituberculatus]|uniref:Uncharacterized protein n=1 Tax=Portunus trituberculatus TaxID=210409 RepID=A0A5B7KH93_PORTR|nr:hypothetical protein [Portunus trituberculatus]
MRTGGRAKGAGDGG